MVSDHPCAGCAEMAPDCNEECLSWKAYVVRRVRAVADDRPPAGGADDEAECYE